MDGGGVVRVHARGSREGDGAGLSLGLCRGHLGLDVNSTIVDELLDPGLGGNTWDNESCPRRMDGERAGLDDVAQYDVVHVPPCN